MIPTLWSYSMLTGHLQFAKAFYIQGAYASIATVIEQLDHKGVPKRTHLMKVGVR